MKILIFENNDKIIKNLRNIFEPLGIEISIYFSLFKLKQYFNNENPNLIIANANLFNLVRCVREELNEKKIPVVAYHDKPNRDILNEAKKYKVSTFIVYPFEKEDFLKRIFKLLKLDYEKSLHQVNESYKEKISQEIIKRVEKLPPFPSVIREIEALINDKKSSASDFEDVIKKDQVITAKVLKIVNSPFFSLNRIITTISESVAYIGFDTLKSVIYSAYASKLLNVSLPSYGYKKNELWKHSYYTACFSKEISKFLKYSKKIQEEIFIGGLLHDIGKLIIGSIAKEQNIKFLLKKNASIIEVEKKYFFVDHQDVGKIIAEKWNLPEIHTKIIKNHHLSDTKNNSLDKVAIANLADYISKTILKIKLTDYDEIKKQEAEKIINIENSEFEKIFEICHESLDKIQAGIA